MFCENCGIRTPKDGRFCENCGQELNVSLDEDNKVEAFCDKQNLPIEPETLDMSIGSLMLGTIGVTGAFFSSLFLVSSFFAVILGHIARKKIRVSYGNLKGSKYALIGLVTGYLGIFLSGASIYNYLSEPGIAPCSVEHPLNRNLEPCFQMAESRKTCELIFDAYPFLISYNGDLSYTYNGKEILTKIDTPNDLYLDALVDIIVQDDVAIMYLEFSNGLEGTVALLALNLKNGQILWKKDIPGFNASPFLLVGNDIYITAIGFVAKLNIQNGEIIWSHDDLYANGIYNSFLTPCIEKNYFSNDSIVFRDSNTNNRLFVDVDSGYIK